MDPYRRTFVVALGTLPLAGCLDGFVKPEASADESFATQLPPYDGPKARSAVTSFDWKAGDSHKRTRTGTYSIRNAQAYSGALRDMLTTALVQSKRFRVLERQNLDSIKSEIGLQESGYTDGSGVRRGRVQGVDIAVVAAVTGFDPASRGASGSVGSLLGNRAGALLGAVSGGFSESSMAMDIRLVDAATTEILAATSVSGTSKRVNAGGALAALTGGGLGGGALGGFANTPMEKAIRSCIYEATRYVVENTPTKYMRH